MLIIGHRGAAGLAPENTVDALRKGQEVGADMLEFDIRLTRDKVPLAIHDMTLRKHNKQNWIRWSSHESIRKALEKGHHINTLEEILDEFFGKILLNLEIKSYGSGSQIARMVRDRYIKKASDWDSIVFSSFKVSELYAVRSVSKRANIALLHDKNPFAYIAHHLKLDLTAVGFHRQRTNALALDIAKKAGIFTYVYTVNLPATAKLFAERGVDGIVTDDPALIAKKLKRSS